MEGEGSTPLHPHASLSLALVREFLLIWGEEAIGRFLESRPQIAYDDLESMKGGFGSIFRDAYQTRWCRETDRCGPWSEQPQDELVYETLCRAIRVIERKQAELPHKTQRSSSRCWSDLSKGRVRHYGAVNSKPKQDGRTHETQRARRLLWGEDDSHWVGQDVRPHKPWIQQIRVVIPELDSINQNHKTTTEYLLPNGHRWEYVCSMATAGTQQEPAIGSYLCSPVNQHSKCNNNCSLSPPISGNQKDEDPWKGSKDEDNDPNGGTTVITIRDEDHKRGHSYKSSFASAQFSTLAISSLLLCFMVLFPNFAQKNQAITAAALMGATLGSLVSLETILKCPSLARTCGYFAVTSLLVAIGSILSTSANWVTI